jgi:hypothetical protein
MDQMVPPAPGAAAHPFGNTTQTNDYDRLMAFRQGLLAARLFGLPGLFPASPSATRQGQLLAGWIDCGMAGAIPLDAWGVQMLRTAQTPMRGAR